MKTRRTVLAAAVTAVLAGCSNGGSGGYGGSGGDAAADGSAADGDSGAVDGNSGGTDGETGIAGHADLGGLTVTSEAFGEGEAIPKRYTGDGADVSPPLSIDGVPESAESLALIVDDPDAPSGTFVHWLLWNVPAETPSIPEEIPRTKTVGALDGARQGTNDFDVVGYRGPLPPSDHDAHRYRFSVAALETTLTVSPESRREPLETAMEGQVVAAGRLVGTFDR